MRVMVARFRPGIIMPLHYVAVCTCGGVVGEIRSPLRIEERVATYSCSTARHNSESDADYPCGTADHRHSHDSHGIVRKSDWRTGEQAEVPASCSRQ